MAIPYASASSTKARDEITKLLRRFGCEQIGFMDDHGRHEVLLAFTHRGRQVQLRASAAGWAQMSLQADPWGDGYRRRITRQQHEQRALAQGVPGLGRACLPSSFVGFFHGAFQPHLDQMQHAPINNAARHRF